MTQYRIKWAQCPTAHNPSRIMFVEAETEEEAIEKAYAEWPGITGFCGNGGNDKLIGVYGEDSSIEGDGAEPEFMEAEERS